eukprot:2818574-Pyramimonas_sp.AAC.1
MAPCIKVKDKPAGYDWRSQLPKGIRNIRADLIREGPRPVQFGETAQTRPKTEGARIFQDGRSPPFPIPGPPR